jgi:predicted RNA-binding protein
MLHKARQAAKLIAITALLSLPMVATAQQDEGDGAALRAQFAGMQRTGGEIVAIAGNKLTVKTAEGDTAQIVTTDNTRIIKGRGITVKLADLKVGDGVMAAGNLDAPNKTLHAAILFATDAAEVKKLRDNLGKTYIAGKVTAIDLDNAKMTVERPDKVSQTIGFDETTSFKRGGGPSGGRRREHHAGRYQGRRQRPRHRVRKRRHLCSNPVERCNARPASAQQRCSTAAITSTPVDSASFGTQERCT